MILFEVSFIFAATITAYFLGVYVGRNYTNWVNGDW